MRNTHPRFWLVSALLLTAALGPAHGGEVTSRAGTRYSGQVLYRGTRSPAPGLLVEVVEADNDEGEPGDETLGTTRTDAQGRFTVVQTKETDEPVTLTASAVRVSAESGGDRREEGYEIKKKRTLLGYLPRPSVARANTIFIERRKPGRPSRNDDD